MDSKSITKSNALIEASYRLSLNEMRIILYGVSLINPMATEFPLQYRIEVKRYSEIFHLSQNSIYDELKNSVLNRFWEREFSYLNESGRREVLRWLTKVIYSDEDGYLEIKFNEEIQPLLHQLKSNFTTYYIEEIALFKSVFSVRIYENLLMNLKKLKVKKVDFTLSLAELKERLDVTDKYSRFYDFKKRVLETAKDEINKYSDLNIEYEVIKVGRSHHNIKFVSSYKPGKQKKHQTYNLNQKEQLRSELKNVLEELKPFRTKSSFTREQDIARLKLEKRRSELKSQLEKLSKSA